MTGPPSKIGASGVTADEPAAWASEYAVLLGRWHAVQHESDSAAMSEVAAWTARAEGMRTAQSVLAAAGDWTSGPTTLLAALGLQRREVLLTRALAWTLDPSGRHGLGRAALDTLAARMGLPPVRTGGNVRVVVEESRDDVNVTGEREVTRADLVVYTDEWTLIVEAKVYAVEQPRQLDRLHELWCGEAEPTFAFLTRGRRDPITATASADAWRRLTWAEVAGDLAVAADACSPVPGVRELIATLEAYHHD